MTPGVGLGHMEDGHVCLCVCGGGLLIPKLKGGATVWVQFLHRNIPNQNKIIEIFLPKTIRQEKLVFFSLI